MVNGKNKVAGCWLTTKTTLTTEDTETTERNRRYEVEKLRRADGY